MEEELATYYPTEACLAAFEALGSFLIGLEAEALGAFAELFLVYLAIVFRLLFVIYYLQLIKLLI